MLDEFNRSGKMPIVLDSIETLRPYIGALVLILYQGRFRFSGVVMAGAALAVWSLSDRPAMLITDNGRLVGIATEQGRALSRTKGNGFAARTWLENDGDGAVQTVAARRQVFDKNIWTHTLAGEDIAYLWGKKLTHTQTSAACQTAKILIVPQYKDPVKGPCYVITLLLIPAARYFRVG